MRYYTISEMAKIHNISKKTLNYYDEINLFKPDYIDSINKYRYYSIEQFLILKTIIQLRELEIPIKYIKNIVLSKSDSIEKQLYYLKENIKNIDSEILRLKKLKNETLDRISLYEQVKNIDTRDLNTPFIKILDSHSIIYKRLEKQPLREHIFFTYRDIIKNMKEKNLNLTRYYGDIYFKEGLKENLENNFGVFCKIDNNTDDIENKINFPTGKYMCMYKKGGYFDKEILNYFINYIHKMKYKIDSDLIAIALLDHGDTGNDEEMLYELQVKIK